MNEGVNDVNDWFTVSQISKKTGIPAETARRYIRQYGDYLHIKRGERRSYLVHQSSIDAIKKIRHLLDQGKQSEQVLEILGQTEVLNMQTNDEQTNEYMMNLPQIQRETLKELQSVSEDNNRLLESLNQVNERMDRYEELLQKQQEYIDNRMNERDKLLMQSINESLESQKQIASAEEEKKGFFARLFGK